MLGDPIIQHNGLLFRLSWYVGPKDVRPNVTPKEACKDNIVIVIGRRNTWEDVVQNPQRPPEWFITDEVRRSWNRGLNTHKKGFIHTLTILSTLIFKKPTKPKITNSHTRSDQRTISLILFYCRSGRSRLIADDPSEIWF